MSEKLGDITSIKDAAQDVSEQGWFIGIEITPHSGYSGTYTQDIVERIETAVRKILDDNIGFLNNGLDRNYFITRADWKGLS